MNPQPKSSAIHSSEDTAHLNLSKLVATRDSVLPSEADTSVTAFVARTAAEVARPGGEPLVQPKNGGGVPPEKMLGVVSYCYSKGIYSSEDIERKLLQDPLVRESCLGDVPRSEAIRRFRRLNRQVIQSTLEKVLHYTRKKLRSFVAPENPFRSGTSGAAIGPAEETQVFARREASERLDKATFGMSM
jgi:Transposase domain (DUF772)